MTLTRTLRRPPILRGFTLIEVLVALVVIAIAMTAAIHASMAVIDGTYILRRHLLANWVAQNRLNAFIARGEFPSTGSNTGHETMGGLDFNWRETVSETPNQNFHRVEERVSEAAGADHADAVLVGYLANIPNPSPTPVGQSATTTPTGAAVPSTTPTATPSTQTGGVGNATNR